MSHNRFPVLNNVTGRYKPFHSVYRTEESLKPPQLPKSSKAIEKERKRTLKPPIIPKVTHVRILKKCDECSKPRCIFSRYALDGKSSRKLAVKISELQSFHCGVHLQKAINDEELSKKVIFIDNRKICESPVENLVYRTKQANMYVCGWLVRQGLEAKCLFDIREKHMSLYSEVIPNCGSAVCLGQNPGDVDGWRTRREISQRKSKPKKRMNEQISLPGKKNNKDCVEILDFD